jgi:glycosyltransferase involved in cell wall biosynthesis
MGGNQLKVTVCVTSYNQEETIGPCLEGICNQDPGFPMEIVIGDDASTDSTQECIKNYSLRFPEMMRPLLRAENVGSARNYLMTHEAARGQYVAHLDGDDFALPGKLAAQARFLDENPDCVAVVHRLSLLDAKGKAIGRSWPSSFSIGKIGLSELVRFHPLFGHSSLMYRREAYAELFQEQKVSSIIDFYLYVHLAAQGKIGTIDEDFGQYTCGVGISTKTNYYRLAVGAVEYAIEFGIAEDDYLHGLARQYLIFAQKAAGDGDFDLFDDLIIKSRKAKKISLRQSIFFNLRFFPRLLGLVIRSYAIVRGY